MLQMDARYEQREHRQAVGKCDGHRFRCLARVVQPATAAAAVVRSSAQATLFDVQSYSWMQVLVPNFHGPTGHAPQTAKGPAPPRAHHQIPKASCVPSGGRNDK